MPSVLATARDRKGVGGPKPKTDYAVAAKAKEREWAGQARLNEAHEGNEASAKKARKRPQK